ncbi:type II toxin-antitoxin system HicA family toxin [Arenibacter sp. TNZ]|uniref:type II toxin-antitoxin system HicA family toxin n=1 Tax=Arenibacter TaxID=178469 RepID=UPI000CD45463|nr:MULTISPECIES: type II toxin-antitoxin system HicA family toxin [Arenibacter]MCM4172443.1 type II toxin-antitoxin system HicA family toxin [Arenibacter sp. TNZ]
MSKIEKLIAKFLKVPNDLTWDELVKILNHKGYYEKLGKGKTGGSRIKFVNSNNDIINLHKPHPANIVKQYIIRQILEKLDF